MSDFDRLMADSLKGVRDDHLKQIEAQIPGARRQIAEKLSGRRVRFVVGGLAVAAAALAVIVFVTQTLPRMDRSAPIRPAGELVVVARINVPGVGAMEPGLDRLWVAHDEGLSGIDPATSTVATASPRKGVEDMAFNSQAMYAIDSEDRSISRIPFRADTSAPATHIEGTPTALAASEEAVWVAAAVGPAGDSQILTFTPSLEVSEEDPVPAAQNRVVSHMASAEGALWWAASDPVGKRLEIALYGDDADGVWSLPGSDPDRSISGLAVAGGAAWVLLEASDGSNQIAMVDSESGRITEAAVDLDDPIESVAVGEGYLWVTTAPAQMLEMPGVVRASLHRIDPESLEPVGEPLEVSAPGSKLAVGYGYVWVGDPKANQIVQIDPSGRGMPDPAPSTPEPEETSPDEEASRCRTFLPFTTSDGSYSLGLGSGGQRGMPLGEQSDPALVHYAGRGGRYINVVPGDPIWPPFDEEPIEVLATEGTFHRIEDGFAVTFSLEGCDFQLIGYTAEDDVRTFVESLVLRDDPGSTYDAFALWPETTPEDVHDLCLVPDADFLRRPETTALRFARAALGWQGAEMSDLATNYKLVEGYRMIAVEQPGTQSLRLAILVREVAVGCWVVVSVRSDELPPDEAHLSVSSRDGETTVGFDLEREVAGRDAAWVRLKVGPGQVLLSTEEFLRTGFVRLTDAPVNEPQGMLVLILDEKREVIGAIGQALPSGGFAAG